MTSMQYRLSFEREPRDKDLDVLCDGIMAYAKQKQGLTPLEFFAFFIRDKNDVILGGCNGNTFYGCLYVDQLWLSESLRNKGYGRRLMQEAEKFGREERCTFVNVNTMSWEALGFYQKLGYEIEFERHGFTNNAVLYSLRKPL